MKFYLAIILMLSNFFYLYGAKGIHPKKIKNPYHRALDNAYNTKEKTFFFLLCATMPLENEEQDQLALQLIKEIPNPQNNAKNERLVWYAKDEPIHGSPQKRSVLLRAMTYNWGETVRFLLKKISVDITEPDVHWATINQSKYLGLLMEYGGAKSVRQKTIDDAEKEITFFRRNGNPEQITRAQKTAQLLRESSRKYLELPGENDQTLDQIK